MKKNIEWLKEKLKKHGNERGSHIATMNVLQLINQLDEPTEDPLTDKILERNNKPNLINHPTHYNQGSLETIEKIKLLLTEEEYVGFLKGNIIKYDDRMNHKGDPKNDLQKSKWYAERLRKTYYGGTNPLD